APGAPPVSQRISSSHRRRRFARIGAIASLCIVIGCALFVLTQTRAAPTQDHEAAVSRPQQVAAAKPAALPTPSPPVEPEPARADAAVPSVAPQPVQTPAAVQDDEKQALEREPEAPASEPPAAKLRIE